MINVHATLVSYDNTGILLIGKSGSGKSDLALRLIVNNGAVLVADDRVNIENIGNKLIGSAPDNLFGLLEVRGVGIKKCSALKKNEINLCVELCDELSDIERYPEDDFINFLGIEIPKIKLYAFECSTTCKIIAKISSKIS